MPTSNISDFKIYDEEFQGGMIERLTQNDKVFNEGSAGALRLITDDQLGNYKKEAFWKQIGAAIVDRQDVTSNAAQTDSKLEQSEHVSVKLFRKIKPVKVTYNSFKEIAGNADSDASFVLGKMVADAMSREMVNTAIKAARAAISNVSALTNDVTGAAVTSITHQNILRTLSKMGDNSDRIKAFIMHSTQWFDLQESGLADGYETIGTGILTSHYVPAFGRPVIVTDSPALIDTTPNPDAYFVLGLQDDAGVISRIGDTHMVSDLVTGEEQLALRLQGEYRYSLSLKGFSYDVANGANPTDTAIGTGSNWDSVMTSNYDLAGVVLKVLAAV